MSSSEPRRATWCEVNLTQFADNLGVIKGHVRRPLLVVVKGNAYGHGLIEVSHMAVASGAAMLGVASVDEASILIQNSIDCLLFWPSLA